MDLFLEARRKKLRFASLKGELIVEQLWDLPLTSKTGFDLDNVAKSVKRELDASSVESFVNVSSPLEATLTLKLELIKSVIAVRIAERDAVQQREARKAERNQLLAALAGKKEDAIKAMSPEQIQARLAELEN